MPTTTQLVVPVRVAFADAVTRIDALVLRSAKQDWRTVSDPKAPTRVEVRYTAWRDPIEATYDDRTLRVGVTVRYAADVRASAKNPLGGGRIWITKGESWGTKSKPQVIAAKFHAVFTVQDDLSVKAEVALDGIDHGEAPSGDVCVKAIAQLCVSKGSIAPMVRRNLERQLVPQIEEALADADRQIEQALNLRPHAQRLWTALQQPQPLHGVGAALCPAAAGPACATPAWLVTRPESLGISQPRMDGADLRVDLAFAGQLAVQLGARPRTKPTPLPKLKPVTDPPGFAVRAKLQVPLAALTDELDRRLKDEAQAMVGAPGIVVTQVTLVTDFDPRNRRRLGVVVSLGGAVTADVVLFGELAWDAARRELFVRDFDYAVDSADAALQQLSARNQTAIRNAIAKKARWKLDARAAGLGAAITDALDGVWRGHLDVDGALSQMHVEGVSRDQDTLTAEVVLAGQLGVTFTP